jgi:hypothetical protein
MDRDLLPRLLTSVEPVSVLLLATVNDRSISNWITDVGLACKFSRVTVTVFAEVVRMASASTGRPPTIVTGGVTYLIILACVGAPNTPRISQAKTDPEVSENLHNSRFLMKSLSCCGYCRG